MRRITFALLAVSALGLGACNKAADTEQTGGGAAASAGAAVAEMRPEPGQYRAVTKFTKVSIPGLPPEFAAKAGKMFSQTGYSAEFCLTPEQAKLGFEEMTRRAARGNCKFERFSAAGGKIESAMTCEAGKGMTTRATASGTYTPTGSSVATVADATAPGIPGGGMHMEGTVVTERIGDCP